MLLIRFTAVLISWERSPSRLIRFSVSRMVSLILLILFTVSVTVLMAVIVVLIASAAAVLDNSASLLILVIVSEADVNSTTVCSTSFLSLSASRITSSACDFTRLDVSAISSETAITLLKTFDVSEDIMLSASASGPVTSSLTLALTVRFF